MARTYLQKPDRKAAHYSFVIGLLLLVFLLNGFIQGQTIWKSLEPRYTSCYSLVRGDFVGKDMVFGSGRTENLSVLALYDGWYFPYDDSWSSLRQIYTELSTAYSPKAATEIYTSFTQSDTPLWIEKAGKLYQRDGFSGTNALRGNPAFLLYQTQDTAVLCLRVEYDDGQCGMCFVHLIKTAAVWYIDEFIGL
ncbi:MAG: hypothetical protein LKJ90_06305 [Faecalibacterium sp.]|jgi:hypothetical protein|nr:hypothetical protein [Faecalibacterium sp.]